MLCDCGAGLEAIAGQACAIARELVRGDMAGLFWLAPDGAPAGFYHETSRVDLKDMFITRFDDLFDGPGQENMLTLTSPVGPSIGKCLAPDYLERFWQGNIYRHLCVPLDHHYMIDVRVEVGGIPRALLLIWQKGHNPFSEHDIQRLRPVQALLSQAAAGQQPDARWVRRCSGQAHFITDLSGERLLAIDPEAEDMLMRSHMLSQRVGMAERPRVAPAFGRVLAGALAGGEPARFVAQAANARIVAEGRLTRLLDGEGGERPAVYVALSEETSFDARCIDHLMGQKLTPLQRDLALFGMKGGERSACGSVFGVSAEALKKHSAAILATLALHRWGELPALGDLIATGRAADSALSPE